MAPKKKTRSANGDGTLRERKPGQWEYRVVVGYGTDGKAIRKSFYGANATAAKRAYKEWLKNSSKPQIERTATVGEWALVWLEVYKGTNIADGTYLNYKSYISNHIIPALGQYRFEQIKPAHIELFFQQRAQMSYSARHDILIALRGIFGTAIDNGLAINDPSAKVVLKKDPPKVPEVWTAKQIGSLLGLLPHVRDGYLVELLLYTGLRRGEIVALQWNDVNLDSGTITVRRSLSRQRNGGYMLKTTKSGRERVIGINDKLAAVLKRIRHNGLYVVKNTRSPMMPLSVNTFDTHYHNALRDVNKALEADGCSPVPVLSIHKCRHTYATYLIKGGADLRQVQSLLGHSSVTVTEIYTHVSTDDLVSAVKKLAY